MRGNHVCILAFLCVAGLEGVSVPRPSTRTRSARRTRPPHPSLLSKILHRVRATARSFLFGPGLLRRRDALSKAMRESNHSWTELGDRHQKHPKTALSSAKSEKSESCQLPSGLKRYDNGAEDAVELFTKQTPMSWIHFGDGEWICACDLGQEMDLTTNSDDVRLSGKGCTELRRNLRNYRADTFFVAQPDAWLCGPGGLHDGVERCIKGMRHGWREWLGFTKGFYFPLVPECAPPGDGPPNTLKDRHVVLVGPKHLSNLHELLGHKQYIEVPQSTAWDEMGRIEKDMKRVSEEAAGEHVTFICAGGPAMKVVLYRLFPEIGHKDTMIEVGSSLDGFAGKSSRDYNSDIGKYCRQYGRWVAKGVCDDRDDVGGCDKDMSFA